MSKKDFHTPASPQVCAQKYVPSDDEFLDTANADIELGVAAQNHCKTRDDLVTYTRHARLIPYLHFFLERRGWLDDDWVRRLERLEAEFRQQVN
jgi:hypothetical protein